jgi:hypothetical protein
MRRDAKMKSNDMGTPKRVTYAQLEKQNKLGKELLMKVSKELTGAKNESRALYSQLQVANAMLAILIGENTRESVTISKELIQDVLKTKTVSWKETEDKGLQLFLTEIKTDAVADGGTDTEVKEQES